MSEKNKFDNLFKSVCSSFVNVNTIKDTNVSSIAEKLESCVKEIQTNYDEKNNFRKGKVSENITSCLAESLNMILSQKKDIDNLTKQIQEINEQLANAKQTITKLTQERQKQCQIFNERETSFLELFQEKDCEISQIKNELENEKKKKKKNMNLDNSTQSLESREYDITIDIKSLFKMKEEPLKIKYSTKAGMSKQQLSEVEQCSVVGIQGLKNKGKTFLLNELNGEHFPSGFHHSTSGISIKIDSSGNKNNIKVYLDTEGINKPARYKWKEDKDFQEFTKIRMEKEEKDEFQSKNEGQLQKRYQNNVIETFKDIKSTDQIQQQFLLEYSSIIIIVVGIISLEEQKIISNISELHQKDIIVVHNLKEYSKIEHVEDEIKNNLQDYFPLDQQGIEVSPADSENSSKFNTAFQDQRNDKVFHCILAQKKQLCITKDFQTFLNNILNQYVEIKYSSEDKKGTKFKSDEEFLICKEHNEDDTIDEISLKDDYQFVCMKDILLDVFGRIRNQVNYSIYQKGNIKTVEIELPGNVKLTQATLNKKDDPEYHLLILQANKLASWQDQEDTQELFNNRNVGQIQHRIKIGKKSENLELHKAFTYSKGVYTVEYLIKNPQAQLQIEESS